MCSPRDLITPPLKFACYVMKALRASSIVIVFWQVQITKDIKFHHQYLQINANGIFLSLYLDSNILTILEVFMTI